MGTIFWVLVMFLIAKAIGKGFNGQIKLIHEKSFDRKEQQIAKKYDKSNSLKAHVAVWKQGAKVYEEYINEVNELRKKYGKPIHTFNSDNN